MLKISENFCICLENKGITCIFAPVKPLLFTLIILFMNYRQHLEEKFRRYQAILGDRAEENSEDRIDLDKIAQDFCEIDQWGRISVRYIPLKGDDVLFSIFVRPIGETGKDEMMEIPVPLSEVSDNKLYQVVEIMRKAMIIEELRNTYIDHETAK